MRITENDIIRIHEDLEKLHSISKGFKSKEDIKSLVVKLDVKLFGKKLYKDHVKRGAVLSKGIMKLHPFIDVN